MSIVGRFRRFVLYTYSMTQSEQTTADRLQEIEARLAWHAANPPTMDYIVEFSRTCHEIKMLKAEKAEIEAAR